MIDFILAPFLNLFSGRFYHRVINSSLARGFGYLLYLCVLISLLITVLFKVVFVPKADQFLHWLDTQLPKITLTRTGAIVDAPQPFKLIHPQYGTLLITDTTQEAPPQVLPQVPAYMTKTKLIVRQESQSGSRIYDLVPSADKVKDWKDVEITKELIQQLYKKALPFTYPVVFFGTLAFYFTWKVFAALFYSLAALFFNTFRKDKLEYPQLLNVSFYVLTPVSILQLITTFLPQIHIPLNFMVSFLITSIYLVIAILGTPSRVPESQVPPSIV